MPLVDVFRKSMLPTADPLSSDKCEAWSLVPHQLDASNHLLVCWSDAPALQSHNASVCLQRPSLDTKYDCC